MWDLVAVLVFGFAIVQGQVADPVRVTTYYESLCPDSIRFFTTQLEPTYRELSDIMVVENFAYGKATDSISGDGYTFECQHGPDECYGNKVLNCGQFYIPDHETSLDFDFCIMAAPYPPDAGSVCAREVGEPYFSIGNCANTTEGETLLHETGLQQALLDPTITYVPWIIINDVFSQINLIEAQRNLKNLVCKTYQGTPPDACLALREEDSMYYYL